MEETKINAEGIDFWIGMNDKPAKWSPKTEELTKYELNFRYKYADNYSGQDLPMGLHPILRYEDIVAHLFLQVQIGTVELVNEKAKAAHQYANQATRKICWNCRYYCMDKILSRDLAHRFENDEVIHKNCYSCRVSRTIIFANNFKKYMHEPSFWKKSYFDMMKRNKKTLRTLRYARRITQKVIEAKLKVSKELMKLRKTGTFIYPDVTDGTGNATYTGWAQESPIEGSITYTEDEYDKMVKDAPDAPAFKKLTDIIGIVPKEEYDSCPGFSEKKRFDEAMKESMAENKDVMKGLADYDEQPIVGRTAEKVIIDEFKRPDEPLAKQLSNATAVNEKGEQLIYGETEKEFMENMEPEMRKDIEDAVTGHPDSRFPYLNPLDTETKARLKDIGEAKTIDDLAKAGEKAVQFLEKMNGEEEE